MSSQELQSRVRAVREEKGVSQKALAEAAGISRQALSAVEAGRQVPSTTVALRLAAALHEPVEALFRVADAGQLLAEVPSGTPAGARVALARLHGRWSGRPLAPTSTAAADGVVLDALSAGLAHVQPLADLKALEANVLVAGCAPVLGPLADRLARRHPDACMRWVESSSTTALEALAQGQVHVAGTHLVEAGGEAGTAARVRERFGDAPMLIANLVRWQQGLVVPKGNPLGLRSGAELLRPGLRLAWREAGAGATKLLERLLAEAGGGAFSRPGGPVVSGHLEVGRAVALGAADAGVAIEAAALAFGLDFVPLAQERFDLVLHADDARDPRLGRLLDGVDDPFFRRELEAWGGYDASLTGQVERVEAAR